MRTGELTEEKFFPVGGHGEVWLLPNGSGSATDEPSPDEVAGGVGTGGVGVTERRWRGVGSIVKGMP